MAPSISMRPTGTTLILGADVPEAETSHAVSSVMTVVVTPSAVVVVVVVTFFTTWPFSVEAAVSTACAGMAANMAVTAAAVSKHFFIVDSRCCRFGLF